MLYKHNYNIKCDYIKKVEKKKQLEKWNKIKIKLVRVIKILSLINFNCNYNMTKSIIDIDIIKSSNYLK